ncbi:hypothetical protein ANCDUO_27615 [Ancylostoma duodenale]|uniref:3-oxoacyl-[acyl-carrier-protein] reductase domain protein n=1 Tax=Ancylostoma duodenale TaxID=51022 RepID=A0A0C2F1N0_9BILA|nr:hypothetical protein ANCDUO_27615 [Ancylostoma duodenale]
MNKNAAIETVEILGASNQHSAFSCDVMVNVSSIVGKVGNFGQCNYAATKAAVVAFGKSAAKELALKGVRVNTSCRDLSGLR